MAYVSIILFAFLQNARIKNKLDDAINKVVELLQYMSIHVLVFEGLRIKIRIFLVLALFFKR